MLSATVVRYKAKAFLASLSVFLVFLAVLSALTWGLWYPEYLFRNDGGLQGLQLVLCVDIVLGPVLAFVIFNPDKTRRHQMLDLAVIAVIQIAAMGWGVYQVYTQRPLVVAYSERFFSPVVSEMLGAQTLTDKALFQSSGSLPPMVFRREPIGPDETRKFVSMAFEKGLHADAQIWLYRPISESLLQVFTDQQRYHTALAGKFASDWSAFVEGQSSKKPEDYRFGVFFGRYGKALLVFTAEGRYVGFMQLPKAGL